MYTRRPAGRDFHLCACRKERVLPAPLRPSYYCCCEYYIALRLLLVLFYIAAIAFVPGGADGVSDKSDVDHRQQQQWRCDIILEDTVV